MSPQVTLEFDNGGAYALNGGYDFGWFRLDLEGGRQKNEVGSVLLSGLPMGGTGDVTLNKIMFNTFV